MLTWVLTLLIGFTVAYFLAFHVRSKTWQIVLSLLCTIPFWTSNVIRMIAWIPLLGRNGLVNKGLEGMGLIHQPLEWLLFSEFSVVLALVHLFTFFMVVPIFNSMIRIDKRLIEAAYDAGATGWQTLVNVVIPLAKPGIVIGSIFVVTIVMGDFVTIGVMGGQQIASAGKIIETRLNALAISGGRGQRGDPARHHHPDHFLADADRRYPQGTVRSPMGEKRPRSFYFLALFFTAYVLFPVRADVRDLHPVVSGPRRRPDVPDERRLAGLVLQGVFRRRHRRYRRRVQAFARTRPRGHGADGAVLGFGRHGLPQAVSRRDRVLFYVAIASLIMPSIITSLGIAPGIPPAR